MTVPPATLPDKARFQRTIGPFNGDTLPRGLLGEHRLKAGAWALLRVEAGAVLFAWDSGDEPPILLQAPATQVIPPQRPHHLRLSGPVRLFIDFYRLA